MPRDLDDTRRAIDFDAMGDQEKRELFSRFREGGGEVKDLSRQRQALDRSRAGGPVRRGVPTGGGRGEGGGSKSASGSGDRLRLPGSHGARLGLGERIGRMLSRLKLYFHSIMQNVTDASGKHLSPRFLALLNADGQNRLLDLELLVTPLVHAAPPLKEALTTGLARLGAYHYELLLRLEKLYEEREFRDILARFAVNPDARVTARSVGEPLRDCFKRLYALRNYAESATTALVRALEIQAEIEKKDKVALKRNVTHARKDLDFVFDVLLPKLHLAVLNIFGEYLQMGEHRLNAFLEFGPEDEVGFLTEKNRIKQQKPEPQQAAVQFLEEQKRKKDRVETIALSELPEPLQDGMLLLRRVVMRRELDIPPQSPLALLDRGEKMFQIALLFDELDQEYSFLLTSNQVRINIDYQSGKKVDVKQELSDLYVEFNHIKEVIHEFMEDTREYNTIERRESSTSLAKSKQLNALSIKLSRLIKQARERLLALLRRIEECLRRIIADREGEGRLLQNPDDLISFDMLLNEEKRLEGRLVFDSLVEFSSFVSAFAYRLNEGDLSGAGPRIELSYDFDVDRPEQAPAPDGQAGDGAAASDTPPPSP